ncbi:MAG: hypothetical protein COB98_11360 [Flavobacteriaceae bacterium]|nr:MAG: hypothetical protein COB98_11360 [Flavobacteriaceae bacterium]
MQGKKINIISKGVIEKVKDYHYGYGIFDVEVYCKLSYNGIIYGGLYTGRFEGGYGTKFKVNDSIIATLSELKKGEVNKITSFRFYKKKLPLQK